MGRRSPTPQRRPTTEREPRLATDPSLSHHDDPERATRSGQEGPAAPVLPAPGAGDGAGPPPERQGTVASHRRERRIKSRNRALAEWVVAIGLAVVAALAIKTWLVQAFIIPSQSMEQTLEVGDRVLVAKFAYDVSDLGRGDVVVFKNPDRLPGEPAQLIKRVVGLPGDTIEAIDGKLVRNGVPLDEAYLTSGSRTDHLERTVVPEGHVFVMGDNRMNSRDSRFIGPIAVDQVVGKAFLRIWPPGRIGRL